VARGLDSTALMDKQPSAHDVLWVTTPAPYKSLDHIILLAYYGHFDKCLAGQNIAKNHPKQFKDVKQTNFSKSNFSIAVLKKNDR